MPQQKRKSEGAKDGEKKHREADSDSETPNHSIAQQLGFIKEMERGVKQVELASPSPTFRSSRRKRAIWRSKPA